MSSALSQREYTYIDIAFYQFYGGRNRLGGQKWLWTWVSFQRINGIFMSKLLINMINYFEVNRINFFSVQSTNGRKSMEKMHTNAMCHFEMFSRRYVDD